jgi:pyruvate kinase
VITLRSEFLEQTFPTNINREKMLEKNKTKVICTIGPASHSSAVIEKMIAAGMNIARLNFSHGNFTSHARDIELIQKSAKKAGKPVAIMADLPGPKIRIGELATEEIELIKGQNLFLTPESIKGTVQKISVTLQDLANIVKKDNLICINDGFIQLRVEEIIGRDVLCRVEVGGALRSKKGLNIPNVHLGVDAFTEKDKEIAKFALERGVDALSQSFVEDHNDILLLRTFCNDLGYDPFIIAKIERSEAVSNLEAILDVADGIMVARGDLGVEIPIYKIPIVQKNIVLQANQAGKPVITATHMLESMINNRLPTRAEATDVANAILDGSDCVMLSGESAIGQHPVDSVKTLCSIAFEAEQARSQFSGPPHHIQSTGNGTNILELIASSVETAIRRITPAAVVVPTRSGTTARNISRYHLPVWILGVSSQLKTCQDLLFSYGTIPIFEPDHPTHWRQWIRSILKQYKIHGNRAILTEGPSSKYPDRNDRMEIIDLTRE